MLYGPWIRTARVPIGPSTQNHDTKVTDSSSVLTSDGNTWIIPKKVAAKTVLKSNADAMPLENIIRGLRFIPLTPEQDYLPSETSPMEGLQFGPIYFTQANVVNLKEKRKRSPSQSTSNGRSSSSISPPLTKVIARKEPEAKDSQSSSSTALILYPKASVKKEVWRSVRTNPNRLDGSSLATIPKSGPQIAQHSSSEPPIDHAVLVNQVSQALITHPTTSIDDTQPESSSMVASRRVDKMLSAPLPAQ